MKSQRRRYEVAKRAARRRMRMLLRREIMNEIVTIEPVYSDEAPRCNNDCTHLRTPEEMAQIFWASAFWWAGSCDPIASMRAIWYERIAEAWVNLKPLGAWYCVSSR
jgi:hypothetical protein